MSEVLESYNTILDFNQSTGLLIKELNKKSSFLAFYLKKPMIFENYGVYKSFVEQLAAKHELTVVEERKHERLPLRLTSDGKRVVHFYVDSIGDKIKLKKFDLSRDDKNKVDYTEAKQIADDLVDFFGTKEPSS